MDKAKSWRAQKLLDLATKYGMDVAASEIVPECWTVRKPGGTWGSPSLTVYSSGDSGAYVLYDNGSSSVWEQITQRYARALIINKSL